MRELIIQAMVAFCAVGLAIEVAAWCCGRLLGENWWAKFLGRREESPARVMEAMPERPRG